MPATLLSTDNLARQIATQDVTGSAPRWLWRNVSVHINAGDRIALLGGSGSGKTLLLRALALLDPVQHGSIQFRNESIEDVPRFRRQCIYVPQRIQLHDGNVEELFRHPFTFQQHAGRQFDRQRIVRWLNELQRDESFLAKSAVNLSGGETQIVSLLRSLQLDPSVLLLDEPTSALDSATEQLMERVLMRWCCNDVAYRAWVWVSHDSEQAERISDVQWRIDSGTINATAQERNER